MEEQDIKRDHRNLVGESLDTRSHATDGLSGRTPQDRLFVNESSSSLKEVRFSKQEFPAGIPISDIKYYHPDSQNNNPFHPFNNQLDYALTIYFAKSETIKANLDRFLSDPLMALLTEKLSYRNADKWIEKLSVIPWGIPNDELINHKFKVQSGVGGIAGREILIYLRNVIGCLEFLMGHPGFRNNKT